MANPQPVGPQPEPPQPDPRLHGTVKTPQSQSTSEPNVVDRIVEVIDHITPGGKE